MLLSNHRSLSLIVCLISSAFISVAQQVPEQLIELRASGARIFAASRGQALTPPAASPRDAVESFLRAQNRPQRTISSIVLSTESRDSSSGLTHLRFEQNVGGLQVYGAYVKATVNGRRELVHLIEVLPDPPAQLVPSTISAAVALDAVARFLYAGRSFNFRQVRQDGNLTEFSSGDNFFFRSPTATRVALPLAGGAMQEGWFVETWTRTNNQLHHTVVGNGARILETELRTANEQYKVFTEHPSITLGGTSIGAAQTTVSGPGAPVESPAGWISAHGVTGGLQSQFRLSGNNVYAYLDRDNNNGPDAAGAPITTGEFTATADLTQTPIQAINQQVAIQNLFWANNIVHDKLYLHGFSEVMRNFQENNFSRGGLGNDSVLAEAQDGGGTNNANFATPNDGSRPRMQMYLWNRTTPNRDGDVDTDIVFHEYGHGLTWRMIGSMSGCMSGAIGEGASDTLAILMNQDDVVGEYSYNSTLGIRRYRYTNYPLSYNDLTGSSVHSNGELFAAIMWRAREYFTQNNVPLDRLWDYLVDGMNYIPAGPRYEDMRNGMVQSAVNKGGGHQCLLWKAFADFGVGAGASGSCGGIIKVTWSVNESFDLPQECSGPVTPVTDIAIASVIAPPSVSVGSINTIAVTVQNAGNQDVASTITVSLAAGAGTVTTGPQSIAGLSAGQSATVSFQWTAPTSAATVTFTGSHNFADGMPSNNSATATTSVTSAAAGSHIGDLDGSSVNNGNTWTASVAVTAHGSTHVGLANATVAGSWSDGGTSSCTTNGAGQCSISKSGIAKKIGGITFTVTSVTSSGLAYSASANHDADSDSDGTAIIVSKP